MLECHNIGFSIGDSRLLQDISWSFAQRQITALVGPNGAGKSTLLKVLLGINKGNAGSVTLANKGLEHWSIQDLAHVRAYMAQKTLAQLSLPVFEYLTLARIHQREDAYQRDSYVNQVIQQLDLGHLATKNIDRLSGGEFQRVELARAWCQLLDQQGIQGKLLLLDEPSSALDISQSQRLYQHLKAFTANGGTVIVVEHEINLAARFCDQILMLRQGQQVAAGDISSTFTQDNINRCFDVNGRTLVDQNSGSISFNL